jgi:hypothetical protein
LSISREKRTSIWPSIDFVFSASDAVHRLLATRKSRSPLATTIQIALRTAPPERLASRFDVQDEILHFAPAEDPLRTASRFSVPAHAESKASTIS